MDVKSLPSYFPDDLKTIFNSEMNAGNAIGLIDETDFDGTVVWLQKPFLRQYQVSTVQYKVNLHGKQQSCWYVNKSMRCYLAAPLL
jgi:hypothetical protein